MILSEFRLFRAVDTLDPGPPHSDYRPGEHGVTSIEQANGVVLIRREGARNLVFALSSGYGLHEEPDPEPPMERAPTRKR